MPLRFQSVNRFRHRDKIMEGEDIGDKVVVLDEFPLFTANIFRNHVVAAERNPLYEFIESLTLICGGLNGLP